MVVTPPELRGREDRDRGEELVLALIGTHADSLLRVARRYSLCHDDAHDAYQRGLEILMRHAARLDPERAAGWLHTVVKHEALAINRSRRRMLGSAELDADALEARTAASPEEQVLASDRVARSAEALHGLKPHEVRALWLKALGHSYQQICETTGWTYTKVNRLLAEGRRSFLERYAGIESGAECRRLGPALSAFVDGEADAAQTVALRAHLRQCLGCRAAMRGLHDVSRPLTVVLPATGLAMAAGGADHASFFMRVYETVTLHLHERTANTILRAQAIVDTATAGKMAAVAASAAAVAGGGFAVEGAITSAKPDRPGIAVRELARGGAATLAAANGRRSKATHRTAKRAKAHAKTRAASHRAAHATHRHRATARTAASTSVATPSPAPAAAPAPAPAPPAATTSTVQQASSPPPAATVAAAASTSQPASSSSAASEFGFEGP